MSVVGLISAAKTALQAKKDAAEVDRVAALASGQSTVACAAARTKQECDRMATFHADTLT